MNIEELFKEKQKLEKEIFNFISCKYFEFKDKTGISPDGIYIKLIEMTTIGNSQRNYDVVNVEINITL